MAVSGSSTLYLVPGGAGAFALDNVSVGTAGVVTPDLRPGAVFARDNVSGTVTGVYLAVNAGAQAATVQIAVDSTEAPLGAPTSPRHVAPASVISSGQYAVRLGPTGRVRLSALSGTATGVYAWVTGYFA